MPPLPNWVTTCSVSGERANSRPAGRTGRAVLAVVHGEPVVAGLSAAAVLLLVLVAVVASIGYVTTSRARDRTEIRVGGRDGCPPRG